MIITIMEKIKEMKTSERNWRRQMWLGHVQRMEESRILSNNRPTVET